MINIFYNKDFLGNVMIITTSFSKPNKSIKKEGFAVLYKDEELVGINIFDTSKFKNINNGMIFANSEIIKLIKEITNIDLSKYQENNFMVGQIMKMEKIENTHLNYCEVSIGKEILKIICGATNVKLNALVVVAMVGTFLPDAKNFIIKSNIQGKESSGMLCSRKELKIETKNNESGIIILDSHYKVGELFIEPFSNK